VFEDRQLVEKTANAVDHTIRHMDSDEKVAESVHSPVEKV